MTRQKSLDIYITRLDFGLSPGHGLRVLLCSARVHPGLILTVEGVERNPIQV